MSEKEKNKIELIKGGKYTITCIYSNPIRVEAKIVFKIEHLSYKMLFKLMEITHRHGFGCSDPTFNPLTDQTMSFVIGTISPSVRQVKPIAARLDDCIEEIYNFTMFFMDQMDFSKIDMSMFDAVALGDVEKMIMIRDIYYNGSWDLLAEAMELSGFIDAKVSIDALRKFEDVNNKDLSIVSVKVNNFLDYMDLLGNKQTVLN